MKDQLKKRGASGLSMILQFVCEYTGVSMKEARTRTRVREYCSARQIYCYIAKKYTTYTHAQVASYIGRDHSTIVHSVSAVSNQMETDRAFSDYIFQMEAEFSDTLLKKIKQAKTIRPYQRRAALNKRALDKRVRDRLEADAKVADMYNVAVKRLSGVLKEISQDASIEGWRKTRMVKEIGETMDTMWKIKME